VILLLALASRSVVVAGAEVGRLAPEKGTICKMDARLVGLSKRMSWLLRHGAREAGIAMDSEGCVAVARMLQLKQFKGYSVKDVESVVENNDKKRFAVFGSGKDLRIRAQQGHSQKVAQLVTDDNLLSPLTSAPEVCVHGTYLRAWERYATDCCEARQLKMLCHALCCQQDQTRRSEQNV